MSRSVALLTLLSGAPLFGGLGGCSSDQSRPAALQDGDTSSQGGHPSSAGAAGHPTAGASQGGSAGASDAGQGGASGGGAAGQSQAGMGGSAGAGGKPNPPPSCIPKDTWNGKTMTSLVDFGTDSNLGSVTDDGLTLAWSSTVDSRIAYSDRATTDATFTTYLKAPTTVMADGYPAIGAAAISPDGLRITILSVDQKRFGQITRHTRTDLFGTFITESLFSLINSQTSGAQLLGDPVLSADDLTLYYSRYSPGTDGPTIYRATRADSNSSWVVQDALAEPSLYQIGGKRRRLTSVSADGLTFFYFDETVGYARVARRPAADQPLGDPIDLTQWASVQANHACSELYLSPLPVGAGGLFVLHLL